MAPGRPKKTYGARHGKRKLPDTPKQSPNKRAPHLSPISEGEQGQEEEPEEEEEEEQEYEPEEEQEEEYEREQEEEYIHGHPHFSSSQIQESQYPSSQAVGQEQHLDVDSPQFRNSPVVGVDFGSAMSAMIVTDIDRKWRPVNDYPNSPQSLHDDTSIPQVPSKVTVSIHNGIPRCTVGYQSGGDGITFTSLKIMIGMGESEEPGEFVEARKSNQKKLDDLNTQLKVPLTFEYLVRVFLLYLHDQLMWWCRKTDSTPPRRTVAAYPLRWERNPETVLKYQQLVEAAGFENVEMVNEAEAAANSIFTDRPTSWFQEKPRIVVIDDNGGSTHDWVAYHVQRFGNVITKGEIWKFGGEGGMAVLIDIATSLIAKKLRRDAKLYSYVDDFALAVRSYVPPEDESFDKDGLSFGKPPIVMTHNEMKMLYEVALQPIINAASKFREKFKVFGVEQVYIVGGTSHQQHWFQPNLEKALGDLQPVYPAVQSSTLIALGATHAAYHSHVTTSRLLNLHLGHLVSRDRDPSFADKTIWPSGPVFEVVEILKPKGSSLLTSPHPSEWHWLSLSTWHLTTPTIRSLLVQTRISLLASPSPSLSAVISSPDYHPVAPVEDFPIAIEPRFIFNNEEIEEILEVVRTKWKEGKGIRWQWFYAVRFVVDGLGVRLQAGWRRGDLEMRGDGEGVEVKDLGRVRWFV